MTACWIRLSFTLPSYSRTQTPLSTHYFMHIISRISEELSRGSSTVLVNLIRIIDHRLLVSISSELMNIFQGGIILRRAPTLSLLFGGDSNKRHLRRMELMSRGKLMTMRLIMTRVWMFLRLIYTIMSTARQFQWSDDQRWAWGTTISSLLAIMGWKCPTPLILSNKGARFMPLSSELARKMKIQFKII